MGPPAAPGGEDDGVASSGPIWVVLDHAGAETRCRDADAWAREWRALVGAVERAAGWPAGARREALDALLRANRPAFAALAGAGMGELVLEATRAAAAADLRPALEQAGPGVDR